MAHTTSAEYPAFTDKDDLLLEIARFVNGEPVTMDFLFRLNNTDLSIVSNPTSTLTDI